MYKKPVALRGVALFIDFIIIMLIGLALNTLFGFGTLTVNNNIINFSMEWWEATIIATVYFGVIEFLLSGKTIGKLIVGLEVRFEDMEKISKKSTYFLRGLLKGLLIITTIISWVMMLVREDKKAIHDLAFKTIVIKKVKKSDLILEKEEQQDIEFINKKNKGNQEGNI
jgi:uncharacterized RDD family membrane protein YckC